MISATYTSIRIPPSRRRRTLAPLLGRDPDFHFCLLQDSIFQFHLTQEPTIRLCSCRMHTTPLFPVEERRRNTARQPATFLLFPLIINHLFHNGPQDEFRILFRTLYTHFTVVSKTPTRPSPSVTSAITFSDSSTRSASLTKHAHEPPKISSSQLHEPRLTRHPVVSGTVSSYHHQSSGATDTTRVTEADARKTA